MTRLDLTFGNRLEVNPHVTERKFLAMSKMVEGISFGGFAAERAATDLKESLSTTDAPFSLAHLTSARILADYDKEPLQWRKIASVETVDDFEPVTFETLRFDIGEKLKHGKGNGGNANVSPVVAEGDTYQYTSGYSEESVKAALEKRGFKFGVTLERILSRLRPTVRQLPGDMLEIAQNTEEFLVFTALQDGSNSSSQLKAGTDPVSGDATVANAPFSVEALRAGFKQVAERKVAGNKVTLASSYYIVVAVGQGEGVEAKIDLAKRLREVRDQDGTVTSVYAAPSAGVLGRIAGVIESEYITDDDAWYVTPAAGASRRPGLKMLQLSGRTAPEILVNNFTGTLLRGGNGSSPFDLAHFDNDTVDLKLRQFGNSALITQEQSLWSNGSGS